MSYSTGYAGLKADLLSMADDYSSEYMANLDAIIAEGETLVLRDLDLEIFQDEASMGPLTIGTRTLARPTNLLKINAVWLVVGTTRTFIPKRTKGWCEAYGEDATPARPRFWAEQSEDELYFVGTPDVAYEAIGYGLVRPTGLSESNTTSWLGTNAGDLLFMACKMRAEQYLKNPSKGGLWGGEYAKMLPTAKIELRGMSRATYETPRVVSPPSQTL